MTRLESFLKANGIKPARLARETAASRSYIHRLRSGKVEPTRPMMLAIRDACSRLAGREVHLGEVFDLGDMPVIVTPAHGNLFAEEWYRGPILDACSMVGITQWPDEDSNVTTEAQQRVLDMQDEICHRVYDDVRAAISEAFVKVATDVLARERSR